VVSSLGRGRVPAVARVVVVPRIENSDKGVQAERERERERERKRKR
jgi:hypothetical protein